MNHQQRAYLDLHTKLFLNRVEVSKDIFLKNAKNKEYKKLHKRFASVKSELFKLAYFTISDCSYLGQYFGIIYNNETYIVIPKKFGTPLNVIILTLSLERFKLVELENIEFKVTSGIEVEEVLTEAVILDILKDRKSSTVLIDLDISYLNDLNDESDSIINENLSHFKSMNYKVDENHSDKYNCKIVVCTETEQGILSKDKGVYNIKYKPL